MGFDVPDVPDSYKDFIISMLNRGVPTCLYVPGMSLYDPVAIKQYSYIPFQNRRLLYPPIRVAGGGKNKCGGHLYKNAPKLYIIIHLTRRLYDNMGW